jgi:peptidoglycan/LPS O-acetylase OafA/YrhL
MKKFDFIDALRGWAVMGVLMVHCARYIDLPYNFRQIAVNGAMGVQLFYIISAFTLFYSLNNRDELGFKNFFIRRFFRIAPMYWFVIIISLLLFGTGTGSVYFDTRPEISTGNIIANFLLLHTTNPYYHNYLVTGGWSVGVEVGFYLLLPIIFINIKTLKNAISLTAALFLLAMAAKSYSVFSIIPETDIWIDYINKSLPFHLPIFGMGIILYFVLFKSRFFNEGLATLDINTKRDISMICTAFSIFLLIVFAYGEGYRYLPNMFLYGAAFTIMLFGQALYSLKIIVNKISCFIGKISYSIYLLHFFFLSTAMTIAGYLHVNDYPVVKFIIVLTITLLISTVAAYVTYMLIEQPFQKLGKLIISKYESKKAKREIITTG